MKGLPLVLCLLFVSSSKAAITFDGLTSSFAQFHGWQLSRSSGGVFGSLSLHFKTHLQDALILYQDDGSQDYLSIELSNGKILTTFASDEEIVRVEIGQVLGDMNWHMLKIQLNLDRVTVTLDKSLTKTATGLSENNALILSSNYLYIGGLPSSLSLASLSWPGAVFKKGFVGCIKKFMLTNVKNLSMKAVLLKSKGTKSGCLNECRARNPCLNKGKCIIRFPKAKCDCTGTGFEGERCEKEIVQLHLTRKDYLVYDMSSQPAATQTDSISIHFKSSKRNGVLLRTSFEQDYLIIKLLKGSLVLDWNLGSGRLELSVGNGQINDNQWHLVNIKRTKRKVTVSLDDEPEVQDETPPSHSTFNMHGGKGKVYIGGVSNRASRDTGFAGCLKKVMFNGMEMISKLKNKDSRLTLRGKALWSCPDSSVTTPRTTALMSTTRKYTTTKKSTKIKPSTIIKTMASIPVNANDRPCSPNDVRCVVNTFPPTRPKSTSRPNPGKPMLCKIFNNCSKGAVSTKNAPASPTENATATAASEPDIQGLEGTENKLGNVPTAIGLVVGSIVLFVLCAIISVKLKQRRDRKSNVHQELTLEQREVDEMITTRVFHPEDHDVKT